MKILIAIPTCNNEPTIRQVIEKTQETKFDILAINDGSTDKTYDELKKISGINIITIAENHGKGNALRTAFKWANENNYTHLITIDADGQHNPAEISKFTRCIIEDENCLIIGTRNFPSEAPFASKIGRKCSNFAFRSVTGISLSDSQSGFRAYPLEPFSNQISTRNKYDFEMDMLLKAAFIGIKIKEVDIAVYYSEETRKASHFKPILDSIRIANPLLLYYFSNYKRLFSPRLP